MNKLYPGKPNYVGPKSGFFTLLHHQGPLIEWSIDVMERVKYIRTYKSAHERPRLWHIVYVPKKMIPKPVRKAYAKWQKASAEWEKVNTEWQKASAELAEWEKVNTEWEKAYAELEKASAEWRKADDDKLTAYLHKHVKDCKWNGKELVFKEPS